MKWSSRKLGKIFEQYEIFANGDYILLGIKTWIFFRLIFKKNSENSNLPVIFLEEANLVSALHELFSIQERFRNIKIIFWYNMETIKILWYYKEVLRLMNFFWIWNSWFYFGKRIHWVWKWVFSPYFQSYYNYYYLPGHFTQTQKKRKSPPTLLVHMYSKAEGKTSCLLLGWGRREGGKEGGNKNYGICNYEHFADQANWKYELESERKIVNLWRFCSIGIKLWRRQLFFLTV